MAKECRPEFLTGGREGRLSYRTSSRHRHISDLFSWLFLEIRVVWIENTLSKD